MHKKINNFLLIFIPNQHVVVLITIRYFSFSTNCHKMEEDLDGAYKKLKTLNTKIPKRVEQEKVRIFIHSL